MKAELFEAIYNLSNGTYLPIGGSTMGKTTAKVNDQIKEPVGSSADEIIQNVADEAAQILAGNDDPRIADYKDQIVTQVVHNKLANPHEGNFQTAIIDSALAESNQLFDMILNEDDGGCGVCASDFAGSVPEHILGTEKKKADGNSATC